MVFCSQILPGKSIRWLALKYGQLTAMPHVEFDMRTLIAAASNSLAELLNPTDSGWDIPYRNIAEDYYK